MDDETQSTTESAQSGQPVGGVRNMGEPLRFTDVEPLAGFSAAAAQAGQKVGVITKLALTSDEPRFHRFVESFADVVGHMAQLAGVAVSLRRAGTVLLVLKPEGHAELWVDTAAVSLLCTVKRAIKARTAVGHGAAHQDSYTMSRAPFAQRALDEWRAVGVVNQGAAELCGESGIGSE